MIVVKVEEWKDGYRDNARILSELHISEDATQQIRATIKNHKGKPVTKPNEQLAKLWDFVYDALRKARNG